VAGLFWPGPFSLVLPRKPSSRISLLATAGLDTVALRVPGHEAARALLARFGRPVAAPSANRSGEISPTSPQHVAQSLGGTVPLILAGGRCAVGLESTVLDLSGPEPLLLRPGAVTKEEIEAAIGPVTLSVEAAPGEAPKSPGQAFRHYAPRLPLRIEARDIRPGEAFLAFGPNPFSGKGAAERLNLSKEGDLFEAAANLFAMLRRLDRPEFSGIAVAPVPETGIGAAINDRLRRAAEGSGRSE
jgi:L-threonylcarbamoyladenylate synthase